VKTIPTAPTCVGGFAIARNNINSHELIRQQKNLTLAIVVGLEGPPRGAGLVSALIMGGSSLDQFGQCIAERARGVVRDSTATAASRSPSAILPGRSLSTDQMSAGPRFWAAGGRVGVRR
jgi:hypothetical protein